MTASSSCRSLPQWTAKELTEYLRQRVVSTMGYNKEKDFQLASAVADIALPQAPPDLASFDSTWSHGEKLQRVGCLFDDPMILSGYTENFENIPDFSLYDIFKNIIFDATDYDRKKLESLQIV